MIIILSCIHFRVNKFYLFKLVASSEEKAADFSEKQPTSFVRRR